MRLVQVAALGLLFLVAVPDTSQGHRSGCQRWHSCPSDTGSYTCGDTGHCSGCSDNNYCQAGQPKGQGLQGRADTTVGAIGVPPQSAWTCPLSHPIKGNFTPTDPRELCIYHVPGGEYYGRTKPERCYVSEPDAVRDGCRRSKR